MRTRNSNSARSKRTGAMTVEFALVLPVLLICLFAFFEISRASMIRHATKASAYEGARTGIVPGATEQEIRDQVGFILSSVGVDNFNVQVQQNQPVGDTRKVRVIVEVPYSETISAGFLFGGNATFRGETELGEETL